MRDDSRTVPTSVQGSIREPAGAIVFDMDGVLADTEPIHRMAIQEVLSRRGHRIDDAEYAQLVGLGHDAAWRWMRRRFGLAEEQATYDAEYEAVLLPLLAASARLAPGVLELMAALRAKQVPVALASSSRRGVVKATLDALGLADAFTVTVSGDEVARGKPDPEIFLLAARRLGVRPSACIVVEDSLHGMQAAALAGMRVIGVASPFTAGTELPAELVVRSVDEIARAGCL